MFMKNIFKPCFKSGAVVRLLNIRNRVPPMLQATRNFVDKNFQTKAVSVKFVLSKHFHAKQSIIIILIPGRFCGS